MAVLALLACAGRRGLSRDRVTALLYPEIDTSRARHRLAQLLHALRAELGAKNVVSGTADLCLNSERMSSDVHAFREASRRGAFSEAVEAYGGPFLDGFHLRDTPEFDRWVESERASLARAYGEAIENLAVQAEVQGDVSHAAIWWRRLADHEPLSSRVVLHLMSALAASGQRAEALHHAAAYQTLVVQELEADPNPAIESLAAQLRHRVGSRQSGVSAQSTALAILPFAPLDHEPGTVRFADGLTEELTSVCARLPGIRVASRTAVRALGTTGVSAREIGQRLGVAAFVEGAVRCAGDRMRVTVRLVSADDGYHLWSDRAEGSLADVFGLQDAIARQIVSGIQSHLGGEQQG
jgi:TolB-like protein